jgi:ubiquitin thioesterase OTU1
MNDLIPVRRYVDSDNSCLFSSIAYLINPLEMDETSKFKYRLIIANYLQKNNNLNNIFNNSIFEKNKYIDEIQDPTKWGGGIELKIFSDIFKIKIGSIDIKTNRIDIYGETENYNQIIYVIYNGVHYDPLVMNFSESGSNELDITRFDSEDHNILIKFRQFAEKFEKLKEYVDTNEMNLKCVICNLIFKNESDATCHASLTGHDEFNQV